MEHFSGLHPDQLFFLPPPEVCKAMFLSETGVTEIYRKQAAAVLWQSLGFWSRAAPTDIKTDGLQDNCQNSAYHSD